MPRRFELNTLVRLPALDARATQTLGSAVLATAAEKTLPAAVAETVAELQAAVDSLQAAALRRLPGGDAATRVADLRLDAAWAALRDLFAAWSRVVDHPHAALAATLRALVFPDGLRFTRLPFRLEWAESANRLTMIDERGLGAQIAELGCAAALAQVRDAHAQYGEALEITTQNADRGMAVRDARNAVLNALRRFVVCVFASARPQDPSSADLARELLAPIESWEHTAPAGSTSSTTPTPQPPGADRTR